MNWSRKDVMIQSPGRAGDDEICAVPNFYNSGGDAIKQFPEDIGMASGLMRFGFGLVALVRFGDRKCKG